MIGKYDKSKHVNDETLLTLWWVQGPLTVPKKIYIKGSTGRTRYKADGTHYSSDMPWMYDAFYDLESALAFHKEVKKSAVLVAIAEVGANMDEALKYIKNLNANNLKEAEEVRESITNLYKKYLHYEDNSE